MVKTVRDHLVDTLDELGQEELKRFKSKLNVFPVKEGYNNIPRGKLEKADVLDLCDMLISFYREDYALQVTTAIMSDINKKDLADRLCQATGAGSGGEGQEPGPPGGATGGQEQHFVERHREQLIQRTTPVEPILDVLHGVVLSDEQYDTVRSGTTSQEKMRKLYELMKAWNKDCKDRLYKALKDKNRFLIEELEGN
ncbi:apoptosis-associated speck-like protein containing a CARD [Pelodiscus sinensis]|uniref:Apoptosis-associated speck-like protein containing a CARD n=1 Tax=Pelodiscus sinensis TaxID=13735 RepID=K7G4R6_PELSI|nr:apoptosis-associated speck-like protein containing a CARD [Pelodiscus sinensis]|eukprot:XP_006121159.1 apoptosis-associated speck-like protein containing a CARD [Pelodiscus sinensis]